jgi:pseudouridylate synthase
MFVLFGKRYLTIDTSGFFRFRTANVRGMRKSPARWEQMRTTGCPRRISRVGGNLEWIMLASASDALAVSPEVAGALAAGRPVVALESTIITHGLPWPGNYEIALEVEAEVRAGGAVPATIAVVDRRIRVGLTAAEVESLAQAKKVMKLSRADLAFALAAGRTGSTTVAATMIAAERAGIQVFATGGIGGVHRGAAESFDISADLGELARTGVTVVAAGAKAILDLPKTLEVLETQGVPVIGWQSDDFPAFWSRSSGLPAPLRLDTPAEFAAFVRARQRLGISGGILVANPVPRDMEIPRDEMEVHIQQALADAGREGIRGKAVTPYLLARIFELTAGRSLRTNRALILNNARLAAELAGALVV